MRHYTHHSFIAETQHGFQKGLSCAKQLVTTIEQLQKGMDQKHQQDIILLDLQKAFDKVPHRHLLKKLEASGVRGEEHEWLRAYLTCRTQRVVVDGRASQEVPVLSGVPQGTVLGSLMFLTYINDINLYLYRRVCVSVCLSVCVSFWAYTRRRLWSDRDQIRHTHGD